MRSIANITTKLSIAGLAMCLTMGTVLANTLSEVEINSQGNGYGIVLKADTTTPIKKIVSSNDKISVILKDVNVSQELNTVYNNVENIENVTVQPLSKKEVKITFKGKGIANSKVSFGSMTQVAPIAPVQSIELNAPVSHYQPVYTPEMFVEEIVSEPSQTSNPELNALLTKMHISREMLVTTKKYIKAAAKKADSVMHGDMNSMTLMGMLMIACASLLNFRRKPEKQTKKVKTETPIGLTSRANLEREISLNKEMANSVKETLGSQSSAKMGYGIKAYQQSQRNPYTATPETTGVSGIARRKPLTATTPIKKQTLAAKPITKDSAPLKATMPKTQLPKSQTTNIGIQAPIKPISKTVQPATNEPDTDSLKFLESITKIYENSGRADLAKGLKDNLKKAQLAKI